MRSRTDVLRELVRLSRPLERVQAELGQHPWDSPTPLVILGAEDVIRTLDRFLSHELSMEHVEEWANAVEMRDDIEYDNDLVKEAIFDLANPVLQGVLTAEMAKLWKERLKSAGQAIT